MPIDPLSVRPASQESAMAAASQITTTGSDRVLNRSRISEEVDLVADRRAPFMTKLIELFNITPEVIPNVQKRSQRKPNEEQKIFYERIKNITSNKVSEVIKDRNKEKKKEERQLSLKKNVQEKVSTEEKIKAVGQDIVRDHIILYTKKILGVPKDEQDLVKANLSYVESKLKQEGFTEEDFSYIYSKAQQFLAGELALLIKDIFIKKLDTPIEVANWILHGKKANDLVGFAFISSSVDKYISAPAHGNFESIENVALGNIKIENFGINDLVELLGEMKIDFESWIKQWKKDDMHLNLAQNLKIETIKNREKEINTLLDQYRKLIARSFFEKRINISITNLIKIRGIENSLKKLGISPKELEDNKKIATRIVWAQKIVELKEIHLKRIFTSSWKDFDFLSIQIKKLTEQIRKLGHGITLEGQKWIESELETLAMQSANYKLNLLRTIQEIEFDAQRKKDIEHLSKVLLHMWNKKIARNKSFRKKRSLFRILQLRFIAILRKFPRA